MEIRVAPDAQAKAARAAAALGISVAAYMERLLRHEQLDESGRPLWWVQEQGDQEGLPLSQSA